MRRGFVARRAGGCVLLLVQYIYKGPSGIRYHQVSGVVPTTTNVGKYVGPLGKYRPNDNVRTIAQHYTVQRRSVQ